MNQFIQFLDRGLNIFYCMKLIHGDQYSMEGVSNYSKKKNSRASFQLLFWAKFNIFIWYPDPRVIKIPICTSFRFSYKKPCLLPVNEALALKYSLQVHMLTLLLVYSACTLLNIKWCVCKLYLGIRMHCI